MHRSIYTGRKLSDKGNYTHWLHYRKSWPEVGHHDPTPCGKTARRIHSTSDKNRVTCPRCLEVLKADEWWCVAHGFLTPEEVTFEERCDHCGATAVA